MQQIPEPSDCLIPGFTETLAGSVKLQNGGQSVCYSLGLIPAFRCWLLSQPALPALANLRRTRRRLALQVSIRSVASEWYRQPEWTRLAADSAFPRVRTGVVQVRAPESLCIEVDGRIAKRPDIAVLGNEPQC
jgi:hypothetical protein